MRVLPNISGTVANWPLNGSLVDTSGNGLTLQSVDALTEAPAAPVYVSLDGSTQGVRIDIIGGIPDPKLMLSDVRSATLRLRAFTFEWTMVQTTTNGVAYFTAANPAGRTGSGIPPAPSAQQKGALYCIGGASGSLTTCDQYIGDNLPFPFYGYIGDNTSWGGVPASPPPYAAPAFYAVTRDVAGNYKAYKNGVLVGTTVAVGAPVVVGNERFYIGGVESGVPPSGLYGAEAHQIMANVRVVNYDLPASTIAADAAYSASSSSSREPLVMSGGSRGSIGASATGHMFRYSPKAFGDVFRNPGQGTTS